VNLDKVKLAELVVRSFNNNELTKKEVRAMLKALWKKYWKQGLDSFQEKIVLTSHIHFPQSREKRYNYTREVLARLNKKI